MRPDFAGITAALCLVLAGCSDGDPPAADDDPSVTFRGTQQAGSMEPTLEPGDKIVATELAGAGPVLGDIVVYRNPGNWLGYQDEGEGQLVHRVIGVPGATLVCCDADGRISIDGVPLDEPYLAQGTEACNALVPFPVTEPGASLAGPCDWSIGPVPDGMLFVMGDNRGRSADSRFHLCPSGQDTCGGGCPWVPIELAIGVVELPGGAAQTAFRAAPSWP